MRSASLLLGLAFALGACGHFGADADNEINVYPTNALSPLLAQSGHQDRAAKSAFGGNADIEISGRDVCF